MKECSYPERQTWDHKGKCTVTFPKGTIEHLTKLNHCFHILLSQMLKNGAQEPTIKSLFVYHQF